MNSDTILLRQAHPNFMDGEQLTSQVFMPSKKDNGHLSVYDGDQISPADSYTHYTQVLHYQSHSVWGVTCQEATQQEVPGSPDPREDNPNHAKIDFTAHTDAKSRKIAKRLKALAAARGCLHSAAAA